jgi:putative transposase
MVVAQLAGRSSLRDIAENISSQPRRLYHLVSAKLSRSNLPSINEAKPYTLYEALFAKLLSRCQGTTPGHDFCFKNTLYSLDASTIDPCLSAFAWADFRSTKGAIRWPASKRHA